MLPIKSMIYDTTVSTFSWWEMRFKKISVHQCDDKDFRGPSWRRQFPPRDVHGISMMPGSAETLPAGFRLTATSGHSRRLPPEGKCLPLHLIPRTYFFTSLKDFQGFFLSFNHMKHVDVFFSVALKCSSKTEVKSTCCMGRTMHFTWAQELLLLLFVRSLLTCLLFSLTLWRLLCSPLWGAGWQSWRHVFGLVSRSAIPVWRFLGLLALRVLWLYIYSLLFTWSLATTVLL